MWRGGGRTGNKPRSADSSWCTEDNRVQKERNRTSSKGGMIEVALYFCIKIKPWLTDLSAAKLLGNMQKPTFGQSLLLHCSSFSHVKTSECHLHVTHKKKKKEREKRPNTFRGTNWAPDPAQLLSEAEKPL